MSCQREPARSLLVALLLLLGCSYGARAELWAEKTPADLGLSAEEEKHTLALSHFAWGLYLFLGGEDDFEDVATEYLEALRYSPDSEFIFQHLVSPYFVGRKFDKVVEHVAPLAEANPEQVHIQLVLAEALQAQGKYAEAVEVLNRALEAGDWREPVLLRELFVCLWAEKRYDEVRRILRKARLK